MKLIKKSLVFASLFTMLFAGMPKQEAKAGFILLPAAGAGVFVIILGLIYNSTGLIILENEVPADKLAVEFQTRYGHLTSNQDAFLGLADMVSASIPMEGVSEEVEVKFSKREIVKALGSAAANKELVQAVSADLM